MLRYLVVLIYSSGLSISEGKTFPYLGCFSDSTAARDLDGDRQDMSGVGLTRDGCVTHCVQAGWPYAGLQEGRYCYCGLSYGRYGRPNTQACNYTCSQDTVYCGGVQANSVYYTVNMDYTAVAWRAYSLHEKAKTYDVARKVCVVQDGDLASVSEQAEFDNLIKTYTGDTTLAAPHPNWAWIGLRRIDTDFEWVDETRAFNTTTDVSGYWSSGDNTQDCVAVDFVTKQWFTAPCTDKLQFVCHQNISGIPLPEATPQPKGALYYIAFILGLPLFIICYIGSCTSYIIYKIVTYCDRYRYHPVYDNEEKTPIVMQDFNDITPSQESEEIVIFKPQTHIDHRANTSHSKQLDKGVIFTPPGTPIRQPATLTDSPISKKKPGSESLLVIALREARQRRERDTALTASATHSATSSRSTHSTVSISNIKIKPRHPKDKVKETVISSSSNSSDEVRQNVLSSKTDSVKKMSVRQQDKLSPPLTMSISDIVNAKRMVKEVKRKKGRGIIIS